MSSQAANSRNQRIVSILSAGGVNYASHSVHPVYPLLRVLSTVAHAYEQRWSYMRVKQVQLAKHLCLCVLALAIARLIKQSERFVLRSSLVEWLSLHIYIYCSS